MDNSREQEFEEFVRAQEPRLRRALVAAYGFEQGREATAESLAWAWEHWSHAKALDNPVGYLFRVGQSKSRSKKTGYVFERDHQPESWFEPALVPALNALTERQRLAVVLIHGFDWTMQEVAELMGIRVTSVQNHLERGLRNLRSAMEVPDNA